MTANEMTFGVEIEATIPSGTLAVGGHGAGLPIPQLPGWKADRDPSIRTTAGRDACEFVSPVFEGSQGLRQLIADIATIKAMGAKVNPSCGLHIHVAFDRTNAAAVEKLTSLVSNFEKAIFASTGTKNRERGRWCKGVNRYGSADRAMNYARADRYHVCNLGSEHPTVEFRPFSASLNPRKISAWVRMTIALVEKAMTAKRIAKWTPKPTTEKSAFARKGEGQTAVTRMCYTLGWIKGIQAHTFGDLSGEGLPSFQASKKVLIDLARKYDTQR